MRIESAVFRARPRAHSRDVVDDGNRWIAALERCGRRIALVIADDPLAAALGELYRAYGYDVIVAETPLDAIQTLVSGGDEVGAVCLSLETTWAGELRELLADEFPEIDRIVLVS